MNILAKIDIAQPIVQKYGEAIYDLLSREQKRSEIHSVAIATIAVGKSSLSIIIPSLKRVTTY